MPNKRDPFINRDKARDAFIRAAAALTEYPTTEAITFALLEGGLGLVYLAQLDVDEKGRRNVLEFIKQSREERKRRDENEEA